MRIQISGAPGRMENYCSTVRGVGAEPVPGCCPAPDLSCGGLVLCGGGDIDCARYGQENRGSQPPDRERDRAELELFHAFFQAGKPILGICRGMQLINVALGGALIQDLPPELKRFHVSEQGDLVHPVSSAEDTVLYRLYGPVFAVNSAHHQAADRLGKDLRVTARSESGLPEALELPGYPLLGVQFHPERMSFGKRRLDTADGAAVFTWLLEQCRNGAGR